MDQLLLRSPGLEEDIIEETLWYRVQNHRSNEQSVWLHYDLLDYHEGPIDVIEEKKIEMLSDIAYQMVMDKERAAEAWNS